MKKSMKNFYRAPMCEVQNMECGGLMIEIGSGNTSPEESDTNSSFIQEEDDENENFYHMHSLWEE